MRRVLLFVNPIFDQRAGHRNAIGRIANLLRSAGLSVEVHETLSAQSAGDQARQGIEDGFDTILVCGGDGTVFNVIQGVAGTEIPVGILPFGTGNVLAQNMDLPRNPVEAARRLLQSTPRRTPLGRITLEVPDLPSDLSPSGLPRRMREKSWYFTMAAGMGLHAALMSASDGWGKRAIGRTSYYLAGMSLLLRHRIQPFEVEVTTTAGEVFCQRVCEAIAVRVPELNRWRPGGRLEEPSLRLATVDATGRWGLASASFQALARTASKNGSSASRGGAPEVRYTDALRVVCRPVADYNYLAAVLAEADGEVLGASHAVLDIAKESFYLLWPS
ncbi:Transcription regulator [contains diacylglycerol kinase catalytic domain] [Acidisarcina polymorpha]|uniref:Transcription regulator [contains diacylglycerol kinase catalytic domain] n=1 Tax=Acidisarcina polymorpha TaxID=2211140 RepID=A0A2Z5G3N0_9BACT|nr:diacylglycerol kinase family protein [Acidisarcina polymorpha]AXC13718.1 Transcription regulator [contains diacylglycerol kinase catalytic domain] [Acidisarcina polymorpha]